MAESIAIEVEGKYFDLDAFEEKSDKATVTFTPADSLQDAMARLGNEESKVVELINSALQAQVVKEAKDGITGQGVGKETVQKIARGFYDMPQFEDMSRTEKRAGIYAMIKASPIILDAIRKAAKEAGPETEDDDD